MPISPAKRLTRWLCACGLALAAAWSAHAYVVYKDDSGIYVIKWQQAPLAFQVKLATTTNLIDGLSQSSSVIAGMNQWNAVLGTFQFAGTQVAGTTYELGDSNNEIVMDSTIGGESFSTNTLAVTVSYTRGNALVASDIVFNTAYTWDSYRGVLRSGKTEIQRVAIHELGHALGLNHPDENSQIVNAIMNSRVNNVDSLQTDDIDGGQLLYGVPGVLPANDAFAAATALALVDGTATSLGFNQGATRETGEPSHATSSGIHSVWWKWTAPAQGTVTASTLGSDFDTVLGVYRGASVAALTLVTSNDDEELPTTVDDPNRKRTSLVTFSAVKDTTYYFAIDGWGDADDGAAGYTGNIKLTVTATGSAIAAPTFVAAPASQTARAQQAVAFTVTAEGTPAPTLQWQRALAGGGWTALGEDANHSGTTTATLTVIAQTEANGAQYRCVATNAAGSAISAAATLTLTQAASTTRLVNLSVLSQAGPGDKGLTLGFVLSGGGEKPMLMRAAGPGLKHVGVDSGYLEDPRLTFFSSAGAELATNDNWGGATALRDMFVQVGAFALEADSKDATLLQTLAPAPYTARVSGPDGATPGYALVEVYDASAGTGPRLVNLSTLKKLSDSDNFLIVGFVLVGDAPKTLLFRGVGPSLTKVGVGLADTVADPKLTLFSASGAQLATNDNWGGAATLKSVFTTLGAFQYTEDASKDAALLITLDPGVYTVRVDANGTAAGYTLVEIYEAN